MNPDGADQRTPSTNTLVNEGGRPSYTYSGDWAWMSQVSDQGWRYYSCVRSFIFDKPARWTIDITDETVARLLHRSIRSVARARQECYEVGLVGEVEFTKRSVLVPGQVKPEVRTFRTLRVEHEPPPGYTGPVNCFTEKGRIDDGHQEQLAAARQDRHQIARGAKKRTSPPVVAPDLTDVSSQGDQQVSEPPVAPDWTDLSSARTDLSQPVTNLSENTTTDLHKQVPKQVFKEKLQPTNQGASSRSNSSVSSVATKNEVGWLDVDKTREEQRQNSPGAALLAALPSPWTLGRQAVGELAPRVSALLAAGWSAKALVDQWTLRAADNPLGALRYRIKDTPALPPGARPALGIPPACDGCVAANPGARVNLRWRFRDDPGTGERVMCECHPDFRSCVDQMTA